MSGIAVIGHLCRDVVAGSPPRPGGGVFYATRALAQLGKDATVAAACAADDRETLLPPLEAFGLPVRWYASSTTTAYSFHYEGDRRIMEQDAVGDPWGAAQAVEAVGEAAWVGVCALTRSDFPPSTLEALASDGRRLLVDAQGLVRLPALGALRSGREIGDVLRHVTILKLNDEEAETLVGSHEPARLRSLDVPEVILTLGSRGAWVVTRDVAEHVPALPLEASGDPTGAGDTFAMAYLASRIEGGEPVEAARVASTVAGEHVARDDETRLA
ncbi:MAG: PfkB family carbohydrate kinase [Gaiellaceae bacterium]